MPPLKASGQSPTGSPHTPAPLASPLGSPASSPGVSKAALGSLWWGFSCLSPLARGHKGDPLCSAPTRPHLGTMSRLGSWAGGRPTNQRGSGEARRVCGAGAGSAWSREGAAAPHSTPRCLWGRHQGAGDRLFPALPGGRLRDSGIS